MPQEELVVHGAREHNLKDITVRLPRNKLITITGLSGSGKSSLAFDTIYAEGQRRYVESLSAYARQFLQMMEKPDVDSIDGLSPAISIDQKTTSRNPRSTVGTVTEIYDYLRLLYARVGTSPLPGLRAPDRRPVAGVDRRPGAPAARRDEVHGQRAGRARPQGRVQGRARGVARRRLHPRQGRRRAAAARGGDRPRQEAQAHDRGRRRPARDEGGSARPARDSRSRRRRGLAAGPRGDRRRRHGRDDALQRELRVSRARGLAAPSSSRESSPSIPPRRLPALHRPRRAARGRPGSRRARSDARHRRGRARAVVGDELELLRVGDPGHRRPVRDRPRDAVGRAAAGTARPLPRGHGRRARLRPVPQPDGAQALVHALVRGHHEEPRAALPRDRLVADPRASSRST